jgi:hypothetical protein
MSAAGIVTLSVFASEWVVLGCGTAFQFTTAFPLKVLPVTIKVNSEPPCNCWQALLLQRPEQCRAVSSVSGCCTRSQRLPKLRTAKELSS